MKKYFKIVFLILWLVIIFYFSSQPSNDSTNTTNILIKYLYNVYKFIFSNSSISIEQLSEIVFTPIRKIAHFSEYTILGVLFYINIKNYKYSFILSLVYSISDEIHQYFVPGRVCSITDILIDSCGIAFGLFLVHLIRKKCIKE